MKPIFNDDALYSALADADGDATRAAIAAGCSAATMFAFKRRIGYGQEHAPITPAPRPAPAPAPIQAPAPAPAAPIMVRAQLGATLGEGVDRSRFDIPCDEIPIVPTPDPNWINRPYYKDLETILDLGEKVLLIGHAGGGKTESARQYAATRRVPFIRVSMENSSDLRARFGRMSVVAEGGASRTVFVESQLLALCERGDGAVLLLDEINMVDANRLALVNEIADTRIYYVQEARGGRGRTVHIPDAVRIVAACNPPLAQFAGAQRMNAALANRFTHITVPPLSAGEIKKLADRFGAPAAQRDKIVQMFDQAQKMVIEQGLRVQVSIRNLRTICAFLNAGIDLHRAVEYSILNACIATGDATGREALTGLLRTVVGAKTEGGAA